MIQKITTGCVVQDFDEKTGKCISQIFLADDQTVWENENGEQINSPGGFGDFYFEFNMVQPEVE